MHKFLTLSALLAIFGGILGYFYSGRIMQNGKPTLFPKNVFAKMVYITSFSALAAFASLNYEFVKAYGLNWVLGFPLVFFVFFLICFSSLFAGYILKRFKIFDSQD